MTTEQTYPPVKAAVPLELTAEIVGHVMEAAAFADARAEPTIGHTQLLLMQVLNDLRLVTARLDLLRRQRRADAEHDPFAAADMAAVQAALTALPQVADAVYYGWQHDQPDATDALIHDAPVADVHAAASDALSDVAMAIYQAWNTELDLHDDDPHSTTEGTD